MAREPNNKASEEINKTAKKFFFAIEHTAATSPIDIDEFCDLLQDVCGRYNMKWCQCIWREQDMKRLDKNGNGK